MVLSTGAAKEVQSECLGTYELTGQISNGKPVYKNTKDNDRYLHFPSGNTDNWMVSKNNKINMTYSIQYFEWDVILNKLVLHVLFLLQISKKERIGTKYGYIYNTAGGETPNEADQSRWLVAIHSSEPEHIKIKYKKDVDATWGYGYWTYDPTFKVQVISW